MHSARAFWKASQVVVTSVDSSDRVWRERGEGGKREGEREGREREKATEWREIREGREWGREVALTSCSSKVVHNEISLPR